MEIEIRARIPDLAAFTKALNRLKGVLKIKMGERQVDTYIKHGQDDGRVLIIRIRRREDRAILTFKTKSVGKDMAWQDMDIPLSDPDHMEDMLLSSGYVYVVLIDKVRDAFRYQDLEINVDQIRDLGTFVEIAYETIVFVAGEKKEEVVGKMKRLLNDLGCDDDSIFEKGYVPLMEEEMERRKTPPRDE